MIPQSSGDLVDCRQVAGLRLLPLAGPSLDLALDVPFPLGQIAESHLIDIDIVQIGKHVDEVLADRGPQLHRQVASTLGAVEHDTVDVAHHVERRTGDRAIGAQPEGVRHRHRRATDG